jgi:hypothetical protein
METGSQRVSQSVTRRLSQLPAAGLPNAINFDFLSELMVRDFLVQVLWTRANIFRQNVQNDMFIYLKRTWQFWLAAAARPALGHKPLNFLNPSHVGVGSKNRFFKAFERQSHVYT